MTAGSPIFFRVHVKPAASSKAVGMSTHAQDFVHWMAEAKNFNDSGKPVVSAFNRREVPALTANAAARPTPRVANHLACQVLVTGSPYAILPPVRPIIKLGKIVPQGPSQQVRRLPTSGGLALPKQPLCWVPAARAPPGSAAEAR